MSLGDATPSHYFTGVTLLLAALLALTADDSEASPFPGAVALRWLIQIALPMALAIVWHRALDRWATFRRLGPWVQLAVSGILAAACASPIALQLDRLLASPDRVEDFGSTELLGEFLAVVPAVTLIWVAINAPFVLGYRLRREAEVPSAASVTPVTSSTSWQGMPTVVAQLEPEFQGALIRLKSELHYLEVVTTAGRGLVLFNLKDAIDELADSQGIRTHRSHWVARAHIRGFERTGREGVVLVSDGTRVPVSRARLASVASYVEACLDGTADRPGMTLDRRDGEES